MNDPQTHSENTTTLRRWVVLGGLFMIYMASNGITMHTLPLLYPELIETFGWSATQVTLPATILFVIGAFTSPPAGWLLDRFSPRIIILSGSIIMGVALIFYAQITALWQLVVIYGLLGAGLSLCGLVSNMVVLSRWFSTTRGRATGILLMASSLGGTVFPLLVGQGLLAWGWRDTVTIVALATGATMIFCVLIFVRDHPSQILQSSNQKVELSEFSSVWPILLQSKFFRIAFATGALWFVIIALTQHQSIYLARDLGLSRENLPKVFSVFFACSVIGKFGFGFLSDYFDKRLVMAASIIILGTALAILSNINVHAPIFLYSYAVLAGIGFSGAFTCIQLLIAAYYVGPGYGRILACLVLIDTLCGALGTRVVGMLRESMGSYHIPLIGMTLLCLIAAITIATLKKPGTE